MHRRAYGNSTPPRRMIIGADTLIKYLKSMQIDAIKYNLYIMNVNIYIYILGDISNVKLFMC